MITITQYCSIDKTGAVLNGRKWWNNDQQLGVDKALEALYAALNMGYPKFFKMDKMSRLGVLAAELLLQNTGDKVTQKPYETGVVLSNRHSSLNTDWLFWESEQKAIASPSLFVYTLPNVVNAEICIRHKIKGENHFLVSEAFDAALLFDTISTLFHQAGLNYCIGGWVDLQAEDYGASMFLAERGNDVNGAIPFSEDNILALFNETARSFM